MLQRNSRTGKSCNQAVALTGGDSKEGCRHAVNYNRQQRSAQGNHRIMCIISEVHHIADGRRNSAVQLRHDKNS